MEKRLNSSILKVVSCLSSPLSAKKQQSRIIETEEMFPTRLLQVGVGEGEEDIQQGGALRVGPLSSTGVSRFYLQSGKLQLVCRFAPLDS